MNLRDFANFQRESLINLIYETCAQKHTLFDKIIQLAEEIYQKNRNSPNDETIEECLHQLKVMLQYSNQDISAHIDLALQSLSITKRISLQQAPKILAEDQDISERREEKFKPNEKPYEKPNASLGKNKKSLNTSVYNDYQKENNNTLNYPQLQTASDKISTSNFCSQNTKNNNISSQNNCYLPTSTNSNHSMVSKDFNHITNYHLKPLMSSLSDINNPSSYNFQEMPMQYTNFGFNNGGSVFQNGYQSSFLPLSQTNAMNSSLSMFNLNDNQISQQMQLEQSNYQLENIEKEKGSTLSSFKAQNLKIGKQIIDSQKKEDEISNINVLGKSQQQQQPQHQQQQKQFNSSEQQIQQPKIPSNAKPSKEDNTKPQEQILKPTQEKKLSDNITVSKSAIVVTTTPVTSTVTTNPSNNNNNNTNSNKSNSNGNGNTNNNNNNSNNNNINNKSNNNNINKSFHNSTSNNVQNKSFHSNNKSFHKDNKKQTQQTNQEKENSDEKVSKEWKAYLQKLTEFEEQHKIKASDAFKDRAFFEKRIQKTGLPTLGLYKQQDKEFIQQVVKVFNKQKPAAQLLRVSPSQVSKIMSMQITQKKSKETKKVNESVVQKSAPSADPQAVLIEDDEEVMDSPPFDNFTNNSFNDDILSACNIEIKEGPGMVKLEEQKQATVERKECSNINSPKPKKMAKH